MTSLSDHLTAPAPHGGMPFHPRCPICCESRLHGNLPEGPVVPTRVKTSLATALVTASTAFGPAAALAQNDADQEVEGTELPHSGPEDDIDPGGPSPPPADEAIPDPTLPGGDEKDDSDGPPLEVEPEVDSGRPQPSGDSEPPDPATDVPFPAEVPAEEPPQAEGTNPPAEPPEHPSRPTPNVAPQRDRANENIRGKAERHAQDSPKAPQDPTGDYLVPSDGSPQAPPAPAPSVAPAADEPGSAQIAADDLGPGEKAHVVQPGESLWSIAAELAGNDASPARIARIVNRLWALNADRIGTGDPDLVMAGTTLRLR